MKNFEAYMGKPLNKSRRKNLFLSKTPYKKEWKDGLQKHTHRYKIILSHRNMMYKSLLHLLKKTVSSSVDHLTFFWCRLMKNIFSPHRQKLSYSWLRFLFFLSWSASHPNPNSGIIFSSCKTKKKVNR